MKKYIVTTTIQSPTEATLKFAQKKDWTLVVVGDTKTPHEEYEALDCVYLRPEIQEELSKDLSDAIGWKTIQRRNMGFVFAYREGADIIATVDDDNIPYQNWGDNVLVGQEVEVDLWESENGYFDPLSVTNRPDLWHRGYPLEHVPTKNKVTYKGRKNRKVMVQADLWDGDPDIDAMCRLTKMPCVKYDINRPYASEQISPFNSQNTFIHRDVIPYYMVLPYVGRMDDIWASYIIQKKFSNSVIYNSASVYQDRNDQDLITNLEKEIIGYRNTLSFIERNFNLPEKAKKSYDEYLKSFKT
jgi:hypothetical protein|tara:strand:+ start:105 stop:1004 length:900 start_codon:yes stop_codon:yes gene_type:complete